MKGYRKSIEEISKDLYHDPPVVEMTYVGCRNCHQTWREERTFRLKIRINGPLYDYDYCQSCRPDKFEEK